MQSVFHYHSRVVTYHLCHETICCAKHADCLNVTAKMATPTKVDSELTDAQLESRKRATKALEGT
jgi:hypothetical protein